MSSLVNSSLNFTFNSSSAKIFRPWILAIPESQRIPFMVCYALILILSVLGNTSIIAIVARNPSMQSTINYLIANMAATDLVSSLVVTARFFSVFHALSWEWRVPGDLGNILCKVLPFVRDVSLLVSIHSMTAIGFDRFYAVVYPLRAAPRVLDIRVLLPIIWFEALAFYSIYAIRYQIISIQGVQICIPIWPPGFDPRQSERIFFVLLLSLAYIIPLIIIAMLYSIAASRIRKQGIPGLQSRVNEEKRRKMNKKIVKMSFTIVTSFLMCWTPYHVMMLLGLFKWRGTIPTQLRTTSNVSVLLSYFSLVINPYICFLFCSSYRTYFRKLFSFFVHYKNRTFGCSRSNSKPSATNRNVQP